MADLGSLAEAWRQSLELNLRYYSAIGRLTAEYYTDLMAALANLRTAATPTLTPSQAAKAQAAAPLSSAPQTPMAAAAPPQQAGVMVLESEAGGQALGVFLVANNLGHDVSARVTPSAFVDTDGRTVEPAFVFDPDIITLASGEQLLVRVVTKIDPTFEPEVRYRGEFTIPELSGTRIPIVLRRRPSHDKSTVEDHSAIAESAQRTRPTRRARSTSASNGKKRGKSKS
jgi:hypothetical protein